MAFDFYPPSEGIMTRADRRRELVFQAIGAASVCWSEMPAGIFDNERATEIGEKLLSELAKLETAW